jgi:hypothetical protein
MWVRIPPVPLENLESKRNFHASAGHWRAPVAVNHPPSGFGGSTPSRRTRFYGPFGYRQGHLVLSQERRVRLPHGLFLSFNFQVGGCSVGPHKADIPVRVRDLGLCGRASARPSFISSEDGFDSHARNRIDVWPSRQTGKAASSRGWCLWVRLPPRLLCSPIDVQTCAVFDVPWSNGEGARFTPGRWGFDSLGDDC